MFGNIFSFSLHLFGILSAPSLLLATYVYLWLRNGDGADNLGALVLRALHVRHSWSLFYCFIFYWKKERKRTIQQATYGSLTASSLPTPHRASESDADGSSEISHLLGYFSTSGETPFFRRLLLISVLILSCNSRRGYFGSLLFINLLLDFFLIAQLEQ